MGKKWEKNAKKGEKMGSGGRFGGKNENLGNIPNIPKLELGHGCDNNDNDNVKIKIING